MSSINAARSIEISEARRQLGQLGERVRDEQIIYVSKRGKEAFAVVDVEFLQALIETIEIVSDPESYKLFMASLDDIRHGRVIDHDEVKKEFL